MKVELLTITPALAADMLKQNIGNRPICKMHVSALASDMKNGRWKFNGDTICFNGSRLIDGQNRLHAVIESGATIQSLVVHGVDAGSFDTKDIGRRRSASDTLSVKGEVETKRLAAALCVVDRYMTGRVTQSVRYSNIEVSELLEKYPYVRASVARTRVTKKLVPQSVLTACHALFARKDADEADRFVRDLIGGQGLDIDDPVYILRERVMHNAMAKAKLGSNYIMALMVKAWNHRRDGNGIRALRYRQEGGAPEPFPVIR